VAAGSVAIGGGFAGIYPQASPGGWQILGRTGFALFDPDTAPFAALRPGDTVRFVPAPDDGVPAAPAARTRPLLVSGAARTMVVESPGMLTMVQDRGRIGVAALGVPRAGAADPYAFRAANRLVGNEEGAGAFEITALGPRLRFDAPAHVAVVGSADLHVDHHPVRSATIVPVDPGQEVSVGRTHDGLRCYLAVAGGLDVDLVLGSCSSDVLSGLGPGPLRQGDVIGIGNPGRPRGHMSNPAPRTTPKILRVLPGPDDLGPDDLGTEGASRLAAAV
jgi:hypothetical protein